MKKQSARIIGVVALLSYLALTSTASSDWIEAYGVAPDGGNGSLEWGVSIVLMALCLVVPLLVGGAGGLALRIRSEPDGGGKP